jgi:hypothetical protein
MCACHASNLGFLPAKVKGNLAWGATIFSRSGRCRRIMPGGEETPGAPIPVLTGASPRGTAGKPGGLSPDAPSRP